RSCTDSFFARRDRPCLLYQIKRCSAPCVGRIDEAGYAELVGEAKDFLAGKSAAVQKKIEAQMAEAATALDFESAAMLRDRRRAASWSTARCPRPSCWPRPFARRRAARSRSPFPSAAIGEG